jgi:sucrose-6-phosphate hydrolase SacC (GH32 family)
MYVDRTKNVAFHPAFSGRHAGPLEPDAERRIRLWILVDASSVEVFGNEGEAVITDLVFRQPESMALNCFQPAALAD